MQEEVVSCQNDLELGKKNYFDNSDRTERSSKKKEVNLPELQNKQLVTDNLNDF
jgi:hypothetical protein